MKSNGFTLIELLGVIIILAIISLLVVPAVNNLISKGSETVYNAQINTILKAAYDYSLRNPDYLPDENETLYVTLGQLKIEGLVEFSIKDPETFKEFPDNLVISIKNVGLNYKNTNKLARLEGNYLYTAEIEKLENSSLSPTIEISGLTKNSDNNYILILSLNDSVNISYSATSKNNIDLTDKVSSYITLNNTVQENIDTSSSNIYKIHYTVIDDNGYSTSTVLSIIISDTIQPKITLPENNTISTSITNFNLLSGVLCTDNSGFCDISVSGEITYGTPGKYIIEYTGQDPSGNTTTARRVITVK